MPSDFRTNARSSSIGTSTWLREGRKEARIEGEERGRSGDGTPLCFKKSSIRSSTVAGEGEVTGLSLAGRAREQLVEEFDSPIENSDVAFRVVGHKGILNQFPLFQYLGKRFESSAS